MVDTYSKWPEVAVMSSTTSEKTINVLRTMFAQHGLPEQLVSDNGPQFTSSEFSQFLQNNRIKHILSAPHHPASNGLAERFVQTLKRNLKATMKEGKAIHHRLTEFLFEYQATPHATTNVSPSELFLKRKLRTHFDLMLPNTRVLVMSKQADQKQQHDQHTRPCFLFPGSLVMVRVYVGQAKQIPGVVLRKLGPLAYNVETRDGRTVKQHVDQLKLQKDNPPVPDSSADSVIHDNHQYGGSLAPQELQDEQTPNDPPERRYPLRVRCPPDRYMSLTMTDFSAPNRGGYVVSYDVVSIFVCILCNLCECTHS